MQALRDLPKIDQFIKNQSFENLSSELILSISRKIIDKKRSDILSGKDDRVDEDALVDDVLISYDEILSSGIKPLINATGVIIHTNLGRSRVSEELLSRAKNAICRYSDLEYNLDTASRGERYKEINNLFKLLFDIEDVLIVNNNAAAVFLILNTFANQKEAVVSRGELVEIGGSFRIPEVMKQSGAKLREIGTTNKTKLNDYEDAINENTSILMKVHQSNFTIEGFTKSVEFEDISTLAKQRGLIDYYDLGSGYVGELEYSLSKYEPSLEKILKHNPSIISFSGDKLFGGVQAGIIFGKKELIARLKKNQLLRMLRVDKTTLALLNESVKAYITGESELIITRKLLSKSVEELRKRALKISQSIKDGISEVVDTHTFVGGGTMPNRKIPSIALKFNLNAISLEKAFREHLVIGRIENDAFLLDFRSIDDDEDIKLLNIINSVLKSC